MDTAGWEIGGKGLKPGLDKITDTPPGEEQGDEVLLTVLKGIGRVGLVGADDGKVTITDCWVCIAGSDTLG